ncbi:MAG: hypothetical protein DRQ10_01895 [Candidatus Hydrothermota bacterium]|nr:MAG: hypothetical protein DRQ10_01895 [Candidatus Hydrothermae bacterium]
MQQLLKTGVPDKELIQKFVFPEGRKRPLAVIECFQEIPCDPCVGACPTNAITMENISALPVLDPEKCIGCARCVSACPGLAIFMVLPSKGLVWMPHEFTPIPKRGDAVLALDREGNVVCQGKVRAVMNAKNKRATTVVCVEVPPEFVMDVRAIWPIEDQEFVKQEL